MLRKRRETVPAFRPLPDSVRLGGEGMYVLVLNGDGEELASCHYRGGWYVADGFRNAASADAICSRAGTAVGHAAFDVRSGALIGLGMMDHPVELERKGTLRFTPGNLSFVPETAEPAEGTWRGRAFRALTTAGLPALNA